MIVKNHQVEQDSTKRWASYAKAAGLGAFALGAASTAEAAIVQNSGTYNGAAPTFPIVINPPSYTGGNRFNIDGAGLDDFALGTGNYGVAFARDMGLEPGNPLGGMVLSSYPTSYYTGAFAQNDVIDGSAAQSTVNSGARSLSFGTFGTGNGFLGFKTSDGNFGWMDLTLSEVDSAGGDTRKIITINGWAYDDSGAAILAGNVPEPNTLALLAAGSVGILARRRRSQAA